MQKPQTGQHRKPGGPAVEAKTPRAGPMRIAKALARAGLCSRREAERWIEGGRVSVNGEVLKSPARDVSPADRIMVDGSPLPAPDPPRLWRYHKPKGRVTTHSDPQGRPTVFEALPEEMPRVISIGRNGKAEAPDGAMQLEPGDSVLAILEPGKEDELRKALVKPA